MPEVLVREDLESWGFKAKELHYYKRDPQTEISVTVYGDKVIIASGHQDELESI